jgi:hypothetical protein
MPRWWFQVSLVVGAIQLGFAVLVGIGSVWMSPGVAVLVLMGLSSWSVAGVIWWRRLRLRVQR